jgi:hypothetical protein
MYIVLVYYTTFLTAVMAYKRKIQKIAFIPCVVNIQFGRHECSFRTPDSQTETHIGAEVPSVPQGGSTIPQIFL